MKGLATLEKRKKAHENTYVNIPLYMFTNIYQIGLC